MTGAELRQLRKEAGYRSRQLAELMDISEATMSRYECGRASIPKKVEYAARWLCRTQEPTPPGQRLIDALHEALGNGRSK